QSKKVPLHQLATFNGKIVPASQAEYFGSYLDLVQPEYYDWTGDVEQYPFVLITQGSWDVTTSLAPPSGFMPDASALNTVATDTTTALQFTLTDVGSDWTQTTVTHVINHKGNTLVNTTGVPMFNRKRTKAKPDYATVDPNSSSNLINVLSNDNVAPPK